MNRRGSAALEFAMVAPALLLLLFGIVEYARLIWTWQALQLAGDQTARCVAIGASACATPSSYAVTAATGFGALGLTSAGVTVTTVSHAAGNPASCSPPVGNTAAKITLSLVFASPVSTLLPGINQTVLTSSCYPITGQ